MVIKLKHTSAQSQLNRLRNPFTTFRAIRHDVKAFSLFSRVHNKTKIPGGKKKKKKKKQTKKKTGINNF